MAKKKTRKTPQPTAPKANGGYPVGGSFNCIRFDRKAIEAEIAKAKRQPPPEPKPKGNFET